MTLRGPQPVVPDGSDLDEVVAWLDGRPVDREGSVERGLMSAELEALRWFRIAGVDAFWNDQADLSERTRAVLSACASLGRPVGFGVEGSGSRLNLRLGTAPDGFAALRDVVAALLAGAQIEDDARPAARKGWCWSALGGSIATARAADPNPGRESVASQLARLGPDAQFAFEVLLVPADPASLQQRRVAVERLLRRLGDGATAQRQIDALTTAAMSDHSIDLMVDRVAAIESALEAGERAGAFDVAAVLSAPTEVQLDIAAAIIVGSGHRIRWRRANVDSQRVPMNLLAADLCAEFVAPPSADVPGFPVRVHAALDQHPEPFGGRHADGRSVHLGQTRLGVPLELPVQALAGHVLVSGSSGSGKSSFIAALLAASTVPFWVIEPVKNEWATLAIDDLIVWRPGSAHDASEFGLNPLEVPEGISVASHIEAFLALLTASLELPDPLPALVRAGLVSVYERRGADLQSGRWIVPRVGWPTLPDLLDACLSLPFLEEYSPEVRGNLRAALRARLETLVFGPRGRVLTSSATFPIADLVRSRLVVNLDDIEDPSAKAFFMGVLLIRVNEYRRTNPSQEVDHLLVLEEAHRLMARPQARAGVDPVGHLADRFGDLLAEIRSTGTAVLVLEQAPSRLVDPAIANTATKVVFHTESRSDQVVVGSALGLADHEQRILGSLVEHEAVVAWRGMDRPVVAQMAASYLVHRGADVMQAPARPLSTVPAAVARAADAVVRAPLTEATIAVDWLERIAAVELAVDAPAVVAEVVAAAVEGALVRLEGEFRWFDLEPEGDGAAFLGGERIARSVEERLESAHQPYANCSVACPSGGCRGRRIGERLALEIGRSSPGTRIVADRREFEQRISVGVARWAGPPDGRLASIVRRCAVVHLTNDWATSSDVRALCEGFDPGADTTISGPN